jgi:hypothetical protein
MLGGSAKVLTKNIPYQFIQGQTHFDVSRGATMSLALNTMLFFIQIQTLPPSMNHRWKYIIDIITIRPIENHIGPTPDKESH